MVEVFEVRRTGGDERQFYDRSAGTAGGSVFLQIPKSVFCHVPAMMLRSFPVQVFRASSRPSAYMQAAGHRYIHCWSWTRGPEAKYSRVNKGLTPRRS
jgi:hypothetical protein